jgi:Protein of unknown function (DUF2934)
MSTTLDYLNAIRTALSQTRLSTYETEAGSTASGDPQAVALYAWNAQMSAAFLVPLHICEVMIRNAVSEALERVHGPRWPWQAGFQASLPSVPAQVGYSPRDDLQKVATEQPTTGKVIPELKFVFWEQMFTKRHDLRLWDAHLKSVFPEHLPPMTVRDLRKRIYGDLEAIRKLRNRIAHHEPIFKRNLAEDFNRIVDLVRLRSPLMESWMVANQQVLELIHRTPVFRGGIRWVPSHSEIETQAYQLWIEGGRRSNSAEADWFTAKRLLGIS